MTLPNSPRNYGKYKLWVPRRSLQSRAPFFPHFHQFCNRKPHTSQKHNQITTKFNHNIEARSDSIRHSPLHCPVHNVSEIISSRRIDGVARNREDSESKEKENDEGEHEKHGENNRGRRRFPCWKTRIPRFRHCQRWKSQVGTLELDLGTLEGREEDQKRQRNRRSRTRFNCFPSQKLPLFLVSGCGAFFIRRKQF